MNRPKFLAGALAVATLLSGAAAFAQTSTSIPVGPIAVPPQPASQHFSAMHGRVSAVTDNSLTFTQQPVACPQVFQVGTTTQPGCNAAAFTVVQDQILVISGDDRIVPQLGLIRVGIKGNLYLKDDQPYMLRVTGEVEKPLPPLPPVGATSTFPGAVPGGRKVCITKQERRDNGQIRQKTECRMMVPGLRRGKSGEDVSHLQDLLREKGFLQIDSSTGFFGPATLNAVKQMQEHMGLQPTGFVGPQTLQKLEQEND